MARLTPQIIDGYLLYFAGTEWRHLPVGSPRWFAWLAQPEHPVFTDAGMMVRREVPKGKQQAFWYAYRKRSGIVRKVYRGKTETLTLAHLAAAAQRLHQQLGQGAGPPGAPAPDQAPGGAP